MKVDAEAAGFDEGRLERITEHLRARYVDQEEIAGCQVAVVRHGSIGYWRSFGRRDAERGRGRGRHHLAAGGCASLAPARTPSRR